MHKMTTWCLVTPSRYGRKYNSIGACLNVYMCMSTPRSQARPNMRFSNQPDRTVDKEPRTVERMADVTIVRYTHEGGDKFEILVKPDAALKYKLDSNKTSGYSSVMVSDDVYTDSGKGTKPSAEKLQKAFGTTDPVEAAGIILQKGELNLTTDQRRKMTDEKRKQIIEFIAKTYVDPRTHLPHPPLRIEQAMKDGRVSVDPQKGAEAQSKEIVEKIRSIIPLKSENVELLVTIPAQYASKSYAVLKSAGTLKNETWQNDGSLKAILEIPAGARPSVIDRLGSITRGSAGVEVAK